MKKIISKLKNNICYISFFLNYGCGHSQNVKNITFNYVGGCDTHVVNRSYMADNTFIDSSTITYFKDKKYVVIDTFKVSANEWFYSNNGRWVLYFSKQKFNTEEQIFWLDQTYGNNLYPSFVTVTPLRIELVEGKSIYVYRIQEPNDVKANIVEYYFDFDFGIVKIVDTGLEKGCREKVLKR
jgi:hypothetical protein